MKHIPSPFGSERRLTPELFDHYVANAKEERNKAIAGLFRQVIAAMSGIAARLLRGRRLVLIPKDDPLTR